MSSKFSRGTRIMIWTLGVILTLAVIGAVALQFAISRNGAAVLNAVDRLAGGNAGVERRETIQIGEHSAQKLIVLRQDGLPNDARLPVVVFFHGGSWAHGDPDDYDFIGRSLVPTGAVVVNAGYRLREDGIFPAMLEDGAGTLKWVRENITALGGDPDHIILMGHSAGAYNAAMLALDPQWFASHSIPPQSIRGVIGLAGPYDFYPFDSESTRATFGPWDDPHATQPVNFAHANAPSFLLLHGSKDTTVKERNSRALHAALTTAEANSELRVFEEMDHLAPLLHLAHPWRNGRLSGQGSALHDAITQFIAQTKTSVPVQPQTR